MEMMCELAILPESRTAFPMARLPFFVSLRGLSNPLPRTRFATQAKDRLLGVLGCQLRFQSDRLDQSPTKPELDHA